ncbi:MAG TPA: hypothetical protein VEC19_12175 [Usitatibacter sp.]|nr:hypothetical protein [Usitatibacter sp.]
MNRFYIAGLAAFAAMAPLGAAAQDQKVLDACIASWGKKSPFKPGTPATSVISPGVKVFGVGGGNVRDEATDRPALVLVRPAVNVMGKSTIRLGNPKGWYCFRSNVTVAGKIEIEAPCKAMIASAKEDGTTVGAVDESNKGVAVFGALRVTRYGC